MHQTAIFALLILGVQHMSVSAELRHMNTRFQHLHVLHNVFMAMLHRIDHIGARGLITDPPCATNIHTNSIRSDEVRIKGHDFIVLNDAWSAFLEPWICARTRGQETCFNPFPTTANIFRVQNCPYVIFAHISLWHTIARHALHFGNRCFTGMRGAAHC